MKCERCDCKDLSIVFKKRHKTIYNDNIKNEYDFNNSEFSHDDYDYLSYMHECSSCGYTMDVTKIEMVDVDNCSHCGSSVGCITNCEFLEESQVRVRAECCNCGGMIKGVGESAKSFIEKLDPRK